MQKWWSLFFAAVLLASLLLCVIAPFVGWWLPPLDNKESFGSTPWGVGSKHPSTAEIGISPAGCGSRSDSHLDNLTR